MSERRFLVLRGQSRVPREERDLWPESLPWLTVEPWRAQAEQNHGQTLEQLHERGGLAPEELWAAAHGLGLRDMLLKTTESAAGAWLRGIVRAEPPWAELDAGIRETVRALWLAGFDPCDSGDGSKAGTMACAIAVPHVFLQCLPAQMVAEAIRLEAVALELGIDLAGREYGAAIQVSWSPGDERATLQLFGRLA